MKNNSVYPYAIRACGHLFFGCPGHPIASLAVVAFILIAVALALYPMHALQVSIAKEDLPVYLHRIAPGDHFITGYVHSVELSPVKEYYYVDSNFRMILQETTFRSSNVGCPYTAFGDEVFHMDTDGFRITNMHRVVPQLLIWANQSYDNRLQFEDSDLTLYSFAGNALIQARIETMRLGSYILEKAWIWMDRSITGRPRS